MYNKKTVLLTSFLSFLLLFLSFCTFPVKAQHLGPSDIDQRTGCIKDDFDYTKTLDFLGTTKGTMDQTILSKLRLTNPEWVPVDHTDPQVVAEGTVYSSWLSENDQLDDHIGHDKNFDLLLDNQYANLASFFPPDRIDPNHRDPAIADPNRGGHSNAVEVEWDTWPPGNLNSVNVPTEYWPSEGDRAWTMGRWVYDCGHNEAGRYSTEIHPASATAFSHIEPVIFPGMHAPSIATVTHLFIHGHGGYYNTPVPATIDGHYRFDIPLPPAPCRNSFHQPLRCAPHTEVIKRDFDALKVPPPNLTISGGVVHVDYNLSSNVVAPSPDNEFGVVIASGWLSPETTQDFHIIKASVSGVNINNCQGCNNWSMWADIGTHWV